MRRTCALLLGVAFVASSCGGGAKDPPGWTRLGNGLRVCVKHVDGATNVAVMTVFDVGSEHDPVGQSGLAHLTEHLYVTSAAGATPSRTGEQWSAAHPDGCDAETCSTFTYVSTVVTPEALEAELTDAAARMSDLNIEASDLERERASVLEQVAGDEADEFAVDRARRAAMERLRPLANGGHGVGVKAEVEKIALDVVRDRARRFYRPANARLVVAGAVDPASAAALVAKRFDGIERGERIGEPEPPGPPLTGTFELPDPTPATPGAQRERAVCVSYPASWSSARDAATAFVLIWRAMPTPEFSVLPTEDGMTFTRTGDDVSVEEVLRRIDARVSGLAKDAPNVKEIEFFGRTIPAKFGEDAANATDPKQRAATIAGRLMSAAREKYDVEDAARAVETLTPSDLAAYVARWLDPAERVVVVARGTRRPRPPTLPIHRDPVDFDKIPEVRVTMLWDEKTLTIHRKIGDVEYPDDAELQKAIANAHGEWEKRGKPDAPVTIDADARIPWNSVMNVVNIIKRCGIEKIEFAMGAPPKKPK